MDGHPQVQLGSTSRRAAAWILSASTPSKSIDSRRRRMLSSSSEAAHALSMPAQEAASGRRPGRFAAKARERSRGHRRKWNLEADLGRLIRMTGTRGIGTPSAAFRLRMFTLKRRVNGYAFTMAMPRDPATALSAQHAPLRAFLHGEVLPRRRCTAPAYGCVGAGGLDEEARCGRPLLRVDASASGSFTARLRWRLGTCCARLG